MNLFRASMISATLSIIGTSHGQLSDTGKWLYWSLYDSQRYFAYVNFSATQNPHQTWTSPDNANVVKGTVFELRPKSPNYCTVVETQSTGTSLDTKVWLYNSSPKKAVADDPDNQAFAKFVVWGPDYQFMVTPYSASGNDGQFRLWAQNRADITTEAACAGLKPTWSYVRNGTIVRYH